MNRDEKKIFDLGAEENVLASCLMDDTAIDKIQFLLPKHFYRDKNAWVFEAIKELSNRGDAINQITIAHELQRKELLEGLGGTAYLSHLILDSDPTSVSIEHYARIVLRLAGNRELIKSSEKIADIGYSDNPSLSESISKAEEEIALIRADYSIDDSHTTYHDEGMFSYLDMQADATIRPWLLTPWQALNDIVRMRNGTVTTIAGVSSHGKTMAVEQILEFAARDLGKNGLYIFLELEPIHFYHRRACRLMTNAEGKAPTFNDLEEGKYKDDPKMQEFVNGVIAWPGKITMVSAVGWSIHRICAEIRQKAAQGLADFVVVDYLQLIPREDVSRRNVTDARAMGIVMQMLKQTCQSLPSNPPLIPVSQVNRGLKDVSDCTLSTLRESGEIAEYSNAVIFIYSQWEAAKPKGSCKEACAFDKGTANLDNCMKRCIYAAVAKNTFGKTGEVKLRHIPNRFKFIDDIDDRQKGFIY